MSKSRKNSEAAEKKHKRFKKTDFRIKKDPGTGMLIFSGPKFTREDIARDFPEDAEDRISTIMRRSVGL